MSEIDQLLGALDALVQNVKGAPAPEAAAAAPAEAPAVAKSEAPEGEPAVAAAEPAAAEGAPEVAKSMTVTDEAGQARVAFDGFKLIEDTKAELRAEIDALRGELAAVREAAPAAVAPEAIEAEVTKAFGAHGDLAEQRTGLLAKSIMGALEALQADRAARAEQAEAVEAVRAENEALRVELAALRTADQAREVMLKSLETQVEAFGFTGRGRASAAVPTVRPAAVPGAAAAAPALTQEQVFAKAKALRAAGTITTGDVSLIVASAHSNAGIPAHLRQHFVAA
jgi:chromosome segregation ATPase